jgi:hypothetical protein
MAGRGKRTRALESALIALLSLVALGDGNADESAQQHAKGTVQQRVDRIRARIDSGSAAANSDAESPERAFQWPNWPNWPNWNNWLNWNNWNNWVNWWNG